MSQPARASTDTRNRKPQRHQPDLLPNTPNPNFRVEIETPRLRPEKTQTTGPAWSAPRIGFQKGVLVLARPSAREDGNDLEPERPDFPRKTETQGNMKASVEPKETRTARHSQCRKTGLMRSERQASARRPTHERKTCRVRQAYLVVTQTAGLDRDPDARAVRRDG